jgi:hypothetical protein
MNEELRRLGHVDPPVPAVLDAAREVLWSAVAAEMLATDPSPAKARTTADQNQNQNQKRRRPDAGA